MKKILNLILCICLIASLTACKQEPATPSASTPSEPSASSGSGSEPSENEAAAYPYPLTTVSMPVFTEEANAKDGTKLYTYAYQGLSVLLQDTAVAEQIEVDYLNRIDFTGSGSNDVYLAAQADYAGQSDWTPYFYSIVYDTARLDQSILSLRGTIVAFDGSPRAATISTSLTYDLLTGRALTLPEILVADYSADALVDAILGALSTDKQHESFFADYDAIISDMFSTNTPVESWYLSTGGLCFYFGSGEIAPGSAGVITAQIPYEALSGILKDAFFPGEHFVYDGQAQFVAFEKADMDAFTQFTEVILTQLSDPVALLYADGTICNVRLETGTWSQNGAEFIPEATVFAAEAISRGDGVLVYADADQLTAMRLTYEASGQTITQKVKLP